MGLIVILAPSPYRKASATMIPERGEPTTKIGLGKFSVACIQPLRSIAPSSFFETISKCESKWAL